MASNVDELISSHLDEKIGEKNIEIHEIIQNSQ